jgi:hypothetical protein
MSDVKDWSCKEITYREEAVCNETPGIPRTCDWVFDMISSQVR